MVASRPLEVVVGTSFEAVINRPSAVAISTAVELLAPDQVELLAQAVLD